MTHHEGHPASSFFIRIFVFHWSFWFGHSDFWSVIAASRAPSHPTFPRNLLCFPRACAIVAPRGVRIIPPQQTRERARGPDRFAIVVSVERIPQPRPQEE